MSAFVLGLLTKSGAVILRGGLLYFLIHIGSKAFLIKYDTDFKTAAAESKILDIETTASTLNVANTIYIASQILRSLI